MRFKARAILDDGLQIPAGAAAGAVLLSDVAGVGSWGTPNQLVYDSDQIGTVKAYAGDTIPLNWMLADGRSLLRTDYPQLFTALGGAASPWGLPDSTHFNIPDLLSRMMVGAGAGSGLSSRAMAAKGGFEAVALSTAQLPAHAHASAAHAHSYAGGTGKVPTNTTGFVRINAQYGTGSFNNNFVGYSGAGTDTNDTATDNTTPANTGNAGSGTVHENMPPWCAVAYIVKATGTSINAGGALVGATGPAGPAGADGAQGPIGPTGPTGPAFTTAQEGTADFSVTGANYSIPNASWGTPGWFVPIVVGPSQTWEVTMFAGIYCVTAVHGVNQRGSAQSQAGGALPSGVTIGQRQVNNLPALTVAYAFSCVGRIYTDATVPANTTLRLIQEFNGAGANGRLLRDGNAYFIQAWRRV
jgi:microcystin-dependent protein